MISVLCERFLDGEDGRKGLDIDLHGSPRFFEEIFVRMREKQNRLFGVIHGFVGKAGLVID